MYCKCKKNQKQGPILEKYWWVYCQIIKTIACLVVLLGKNIYYNIRYIKNMESLKYQIFPLALKWCNPLFIILFYFEKTDNSLNKKNLMLWKLIENCHKLRNDYILLYLNVKKTILHLKIFNMDWIWCIIMPVHSTPLSKMAALQRHQWNIVSLSQL